MRRISSLTKSRAYPQPFQRGPSNSAVDYDDLSDVQSVSKESTSTAVRDEPLPVPSLKVKRVDHYYSRWTKGWKYRVSISSSLTRDMCLMRTG